MSIFKLFYYSHLAFPSFVKDKEFKQLITLMLNKNPANRLLKFAQIKNHVWFKKFDWVNF